jgi:hypothetical protein
LAIARRPFLRSRVQEWFNRAAFSVNAVGTIGTGRRNQLRSPGAWNADYSLFKAFSFKERTGSSFGPSSSICSITRGQALTLAVTSSTFGRITSAYDPRIVQLGLKLIFRTAPGKAPVDPTEPV